MSSEPGRSGNTLYVRVPATAANLGPGFDCVALALSLYNSVEITELPRGSTDTIEITGEGATTLGRTNENLMLRAMRSLAAAHQRILPPLAIRMRNEVPLCRGLGSSAAAIAAGLLASAVLLDVEHEPQSLLPFALPLEGHPDNIVAALWGGCTIGALVGGGAVVHRITAPDRLHAVVLVPNAFSSTFESRAILPTEVPRADAVFNASRVGLFVAALTEDRLDLLHVAMEDRLHQPYRGESFRYLQPTIAAAIQAGARGAALSGAGSSVIALASHNFGAIAQAMSGVASDHNISARTLLLPLDLTGATYEWRS